VRAPVTTIHPFWPWYDGHDTGQSVIRGIGHTGRLVTSGALILFLAFVGFVGFVGFLGFLALGGVRSRQSAAARPQPSVDRQQAAD
jgi:hypothetical protein